VLTIDLAPSFVAVFSHADPAAADDRYAVRGRKRRQLGARAVGGHAGARERRRERLVDAGGVQQIFRVRHEQMRRIPAGTVDAKDPGAGDAVVLLPGLANRAFSAANPRMDQALLSHLHALRFRSERLDDAERLVAERERRHAAALLYVEALAAAEVEVAFPDMQVRVAHARARDAHQHLAPLRFRRVERDFLQGLAMLGDLVRDHVLAASWSA
jgi:hypothetical protein